MPPIDLKPSKTFSVGRYRPDFGTVRPRVQIPGPRPISELGIIQKAELT